MHAARPRSHGRLGTTGAPTDRIMRDGRRRRRAPTGLLLSIWSIIRKQGPRDTPKLPKPCVRCTCTTHECRHVLCTRTTLYPYHTDARASASPPPTGSTVVSALPWSMMLLLFVFFSPSPHFLFLFRPCK